MPKGLLLAAVTVLFWAMFDVYTRYAAIEWQVDYIVFITYTNIASALTLLLIAGPGRLGVATLRTPHTWIYSVINVLSDIVFMALYALVTVTEGNFSARFNIILILFLAWFFIGRRPSKWDALFGLGIFVGCGVVVSGFDESIRPLAMLLIFLGALLQSIRILTAEMHETAKEAISIKERCRVTGFVLLATSAFFLIMALACAGLNASSSAEMVPMLQYLPTFADFGHAPTILAGLVLGMFNMSIATYLFFRSSQIVKGEVMAAITAFLPLYTFVMEFIVSRFGFLDLNGLSSRDLVAGVIITLSAFGMVYMRQRAEKRILTREVI